MMDYQDKKKDLEIAMFKFVTRGNEEEAEMKVNHQLMSLPD
jgi:hypothetical protein